MDRQAQLGTAIIVIACIHAAACMSAPLNGQQVSSRSEPIAFSGGWTAGNQRIDIQNASDPAGPFASFAHADTAASSPFTLFAWSTNAVVPGWRATGCGTFETFVRAIGPRFSLITFDDESLSGESWTDCISARTREGSSTLLAIAQCQSPQSPVVRITAHESTFVGDVIIATQSEADAYACYREIDGSLTIADSAELAIALPNLARVTGDLQVVYPIGAAVDGGGYSLARSVELASLAQVDGDIDLTLRAPGHRASIDVGLPALTVAAGNLSFSASFSTGMNFRGLANLTRVFGNLSILLPPGDFSATALRALVAVDGDVTVQASNQFNVLDQLATIGGDFNLVHGTIHEGAYEAVRTVGGDLHLDRVTAYAAAGSGFLPLLTRVSGMLDVEQTTFMVHAASSAEPLVGSSTDLVIGALRLDQNPDLADLAARSITVAGSGPITITNNPRLSQCDAQRFVDDQIGAGWMGTAVVTGNMTCP